jgi:quercetin dioxygenase-like cupin family protein
MTTAIANGHLWFLDTLVEVKHAPSATAEYSLIDATARPGNTVPLHSHDEDEVITVLEGELTFMVDGVPTVLGPGQSVVAPRDAPHRYEVTSGGDTRWLVLTTPGRFGEFVAEISRPAEATSLPPVGDPPTAAELAHLAATAARHGITILPS